MKARSIMHHGEKYLCADDIKYVIGNSHVLRLAINEYLLYMEAGDSAHVALQKAIAVVFAVASGEVIPPRRPDELN